MFVAIEFVRPSFKNENLLFDAGDHGQEVLLALSGLARINTSRSRMPHVDFSEELIPDDLAKRLLEGRRTRRVIDVKTVVNAIAQMDDDIHFEDLKELFLAKRGDPERPCPCLMQIVNGESSYYLTESLLTHLHLKEPNEAAKRVVYAYFSTLDESRWLDSLTK